MFSAVPSIRAHVARAFLAVALLAAFGGVGTHAKSVTEKTSGLGTFRGFVRDNSGKPITGALISIFQSESLELFKQIKSAADGSFAARLIPGKYTIIAAANGFDSTGFSSIEITRSSDLVYKFKLQPSGVGKTVPERRPDRKNSMWMIRSSQIRRSIFQHREGDAPSDEDAAALADDTSSEPSTTQRRAQAVVESYFGSAAGNGFTGLNFATFKPLSENSEVILAGQYSTGKGPLRLESEFRTRPNNNNQLKAGFSLAQLRGGGFSGDTGLGQVSLQVTDELRLKKSVIIVLGVDASKFLGAGNDFVISPRLGLQFDADTKTRVRTSYTTQTEDKNWQSAIDFEGAQVFFREPASMQDVYVAKGRPLMNRSSRLEFGVERILDSRSSVEANVFIDLTTSRGVGLVNLPVDFLSDGGESFVANQQGRTQGVRVVYARRINGRLSTAAGYAFGRGQKLNISAETPNNLFKDDNFQTFFGQFGAEVVSGTNVRTIFRLSPQATIFAIDPFQGRLAIYDPSLSVIVTQSLPNMGLPIRAEAVIDARNLLDYQAGANGDEGAVKVLSQRRVLRGGIKVRF